MIEEKKICKYCGAEFIPPDMPFLDSAVFCRPACRTKYKANERARKNYHKRKEQRKLV